MSAHRLTRALWLVATLTLACRHARPTAPAAPSSAMPTTTPEVIEWLLGGQVRGPKTRHRGDVGIATYDLSQASAQPTLTFHPETCASDLVQIISTPTRSGTRFAIDKAGHLLRHTSSGWSTVPSTKPLPSIGKLVAFSTATTTPTHLELLVSLQSHDRKLFLLILHDYRVTGIQPVDLHGFRDRRSTLQRWDSGRCVEGVRNCLHLVSADGRNILVREPRLFDHHEELPVTLGKGVRDVRYADAAGIKLDVLTPDACTPTATSEPEASAQPKVAP
ncbi:hypothetical protein [Paraliomyxa miuraensis]|uniref:hypothetical protein n=1 Tax=Paraliomyxa miuraensis TaxID=376150 RepID=UPI00225012D0|nr:hypothetical protein [Paraliomyxa miuraensis]MCX4246480.1 hypothetical protein [Paraliomyxa miuraensis]